MGKKRKKEVNFEKANHKVVRLYRIFCVAGILINLLNIILFFYNQKLLSIINIGIEMVWLSLGWAAIFLLIFLYTKTRMALPPKKEERSKLLGIAITYNRINKAGFLVNVIFLVGVIFAMLISIVFLIFLSKSIYLLGTI